MVKMYLADRRRGPVGDYQGLASFNLAPPPHQATRELSYCCIAIYGHVHSVFFSNLYITIGKFMLNCVQNTGLALFFAPSQASLSIAVLHCACLLSVQ